MEHLARKMIQLPYGETASNLPMAIRQLGQNLDMRPRVRIGLWPVISVESPELAMGLSAVLAALLERWQDIRVYRIWVQLDGEPNDYVWTIRQSQFGVDDWRLEQLDENCAIWGTLARQDGNWILALEVESDFIDGEELASFTVEASNIAGIVNLLPEMAGKIAGYFESPGKITTRYADTTATDESLTALFADITDWYARLFLFLWGKAWADADIVAELEKLIEVGQFIGDEFAAWCVAGSVAHAMQPGYGDVATTLSRVILSVVDSFPNTYFPATYIGSALYRVGQAQEAVELLERTASHHPNQVVVWQTLANLYRIGGRLLEAVDTLQRAIENDAVSANLYLTYAALLMTFDAEEMELDTFILVTPEKYAANLLLWEAAEAYGEAFRLDSDQLAVLQQRILLLIDLHATGDQLWDDFEMLVKQDTEGEYVRGVVDAFFNVDNPDPGIDRLQQQLELMPDRIDLYVNLAVAYLNIEETDQALDLLERAEEMTEDVYILMDIQRLMLAANNPEFETRVGEIAAIVNAGHTIKVEDADFLETVIEEAPLFAEGYVLLGKTYLNWGEQNDALDILLDGHKQLPDDPDIIEVLAGVLWESGEHELAFDYLNKGIEANPNHVPLLALTGLYLFDDDQPDSARAYLSRAESLAPHDPVLARVREQIVRLMNERD